MKKIIFGLLVVVFFINLIPTTVTASPSIFLPEQVLFGTSATYSAGQVGNMTFIDSDKSTDRRQNIEYGVAQTFTEGLITSYEILTTKEIDISGFDAIPGLTVEIPNVIASQGTSSPKTYVAYIKFSEKNNQDNASFYASKEFSITPNSTPYTSVKNVNLLMSNGDRFFTIHGPSIYTPEEAAADQYISSSTSLEITFESNVETVLNPKIIFTKLRSSSFKEEFVPAPITIKKGLNYIVIPLPVFGYEPGVYIGQMVIDSKTLKNTVDLQYIVSGESVTVGSPVLITKDSKEHVSFDIFSTPIDLDRDTELVNTSALSATTSTSTPVFYSTTIELLDKDKKVLSTITQDVDFMQERFSVEIPVAKFKKLDIEYTHIKVISPRTGKVVYEGTKDFTYVSLPEIDLYEIGFVAMYILLLIAVLFFAFTRDLKKAIAFAILLGILFISKSAFGLVTQGLYPLDGTVVSWQPTASQLINVSGQVQSEHYPKFFFQDDVVNRTYTCGVPKTITFTVRYIMCSNATPILQVGASMVSLAAAEGSRSGIGLASAQEGVGSVGAHSYYRRLSEFRTATVPASQSGTQYLHLHVYHKASATTNEIYRGYSNNVVPITTGSCSACTNAPGTSNIPNFKVHGRNYYYSATDEKLYYREAPAGANMSTPDACGIDLCADTSDIETDFPSGKIWSPQPPSNSTDPNRYACVGMNITCACQGRNRVCTNSTMGTTSTDINHSSCLLRAYCSVSYFGTNSGTVTFDAYNKLGSLTFDPDENPVIRESIAIGNELITRNVIDIDGRDAEASCLLEYGGGILHGNTGSSTIIKFYADPKVVDAGRMCHFGWETNNMESCSINSVNYATNTFPGDPESYSALPSGERNLRVTLSCYGVVDPENGGPAPLVATTTTCFVNPKIQEN